MADAYTVVGQYPDTEYLGGTATRAVTAVQYTTKPHGVYFEARIPDAELSTDTVDSTGRVDSEALEALYSIDGVTDVEWTQVSTPSGYLDDEIIVYFQTPSGNSSGSVTEPFTGLSQSKTSKDVASAIANLQEIEGL